MVTRKRAPFSRTTDMGKNRWPYFIASRAPPPADHTDRPKKGPSTPEESRWSLSRATAPPLDNAPIRPRTPSLPRAANICTP